MEQMEQIDLSAIGLDNQEAQEQAMTQIQQMKQEKGHNHSFQTTRNM